MHDVVDAFEYKGTRYRANGFLRFRSPGRLEWCKGVDAQFVTGVSVCGVIAPVARVRWVGTIPWEQDVINRERSTYDRCYVGRAVYDLMPETLKRMKEEISA